MPIVDHSYQLQRQNVVKNVDKLIQLCIQIVTETKNGQFAEHLLAHLLTFFCE